MGRVQLGDLDAFREVYDLTIAATHARAVRTTRSVDHAVEVVQEVYLYAWQHAAAYDPDRASVLTWLLMITHRRAVDRVRAVTSTVLREEQDFHRSPTVVPDIADVGLANHEAGLLRAAVEQLTAKQRDAVSLTYLQGYTICEAASMLDVPTGTVKTRVRAGVAALRQQFMAAVA